MHSASLPTLSSAWNPCLSDRRRLHELCQFGLNWRLYVCICLTVSSPWQASTTSSSSSTWGCSPSCFLYKGKPKTICGKWDLLVSNQPTSIARIHFAQSGPRSLTLCVVVMLSYQQLKLEILYQYSHVLWANENKSAIALCGYMMHETAWLQPPVELLCKRFSEGHTQIWTNC